ncbi:hypothetical protein BOTBODRAFT_610523 [Botryobasidium botryosum FD-172 SS1]|uniref:PH domain-containing protein n=1 Tax=Botryobasidium botryosum (strain FD-172 SS1) TaxID=930990 RepID=A0A067LYB9_BOTB1|nr:hypothetical protein BOTBODRAFT_610523 [Botryobasidium botryosum FD-172 SS1]
MKEEKDDLEKSVEALRATLRQQELSADKFKEENWNLEVTLQELRAQLSEAQATTSRIEADQKRTIKQLTAARESVDSYKNETEKLAATLDELKAKHETDVAQMRKNNAGLQREKSDLQTAIDTLKADFAKKERERGIKRLGSPSTPNGDSFLMQDGDEDDVFSTGGISSRRGRPDTSALFTPQSGFDFDMSPDASPSKPSFMLSPAQPANELEALKQSLAHAHRQIASLRNTANREKELKMEYRRKLALEGHAPDTWEDDDDQEEDMSASGIKPPRSASSFRGRGRGRGRGMMSLAKKLGIAAAHAAFDSPTSSPAPRVPRVRDVDDEDEDEEEAQMQARERELEELRHQREQEREPRRPLPIADVLSPVYVEEPQVSSRPTSVDGMDPIYANILRSIPSSSTVPAVASPLKPVTRAGPRRSRGGAAYKSTPRPASLIEGSTNLLSNELVGLGGLEDMDTSMGMGMGHEGETSSFGASILEESDLGVEVAQEEDDEEISLPYTRERVYADMGIQAEPVVEEVVPVPVPEPAPAPVVVETAEMDVQTEPEVVPEPVVVETAEMDIQTEPEVVPSPPQMAEISMQTDEVPVPVQAPLPVVAPVIIREAPPAPETSEVSMQTEEFPVVLVDMGMGTDPIALPKLVDSGMLTDEIPVPVKDVVEMQTQTFVSAAEVEVQTMSPPALMEMEIQTTPILSPTVPSVHEMDIQTISPPQTSEAEVQVDLQEVSPPIRTNGYSSGVVAPWARLSDFGVRPTNMSRISLDDDDGEKTETEPETETETEYLDARESMGDGTTTRSESQAEFYSLASNTESNLAQDSDGEDSIRAPRVPFSNSSPLASRRKVTTTSTAVEVKPEVKEESVQTEEWRPSTPAPSHTPAPPSPVPGFRRIGDTAAQFQYITSPSNSASTVTPMSNAIGLSTKIPHRDSSGTFGGRTRSQTPSLLSPVERRLSVDSVHGDEPGRLSPRPTPPVLAPPPVDKTRPPTMMLPPPPSMPPPSFIPKKIPNGNGIPPPRPTSPPPPELIQRATTPTFNRATTPIMGAISSLTVPRSHIRQHGSSMPPSAQGLRQPPSTSSFRSAAHAASAAGQRAGTSTTLSFMKLVSQSSAASHPASASSRSSDQHHGKDLSMTKSNPPTPAKNQNLMMTQSTDPNIIHAITQTMIGEFMYKYTRRVVGKGYGEKRHKRFFWVHPYTKTLYWSSADPGASNASESNAKSAYISDVVQVMDPNPLPPGLYQYSVIVQTPQRDMKFTAPTKERHDIWFNALKYLLARPTTVPMSSSPGPSAESSGTGPLSPNSAAQFRIRSPSAGNDGTRRDVMASPRSVRSNHSRVSVDSWNITPRALRSQTQLSANPGSSSVGKRIGTPAAEYIRWAGQDAQSPTKSIKSLPRYGAQASFDDDGDYENVEHQDGDLELHEDDAYEGLENVRACCDGEHDLGSLTRKPGHHHHHHNGNYIRPTSPLPGLDLTLSAAARPVSPAWSFRSNSGREGEGSRASIFSWGNGDGTRSMRFGSKRSNKTVPTQEINLNDR